MLDESGQCGVRILLEGALFAESRSRNARMRLSEAICRKTVVCDVRRKKVNAVVL